MRTSRCILSLTAALMGFLLMNVPAHAQGVQTGTITGQIVDQSDAVLPGATVTVTSPSLQGERSAVTDSTGRYLIRGLPAGVYSVRVELPGMTTAERMVDVGVGTTVEVGAQLRVAAVTERVTVTADTTPFTVTTTQVGINLEQQEIEALATPRSLQGIATMAPGVTENTPNSGQLTISGAFAYDNLFMIDGVDISDNLNGTVNNLFIEDAIAETQVLTSGISAEYGRFSGGVVNAVSKSGGNTFSGSFRLNMTNPAWIVETPFAKEAGTENVSKLNESYEGTFGGPIVRDRLWFFTAGRYISLADNPILPITGARIDAPETNKRGEVKLTATVATNHIVEGSYLNNSRDLTRVTFPFSIDPNALESPSFPNTRFVAGWRGVVGARAFAEAQYSQKKFGFRGSGGTSTDIFDSPFITLTQELAHYNAPYFDATDPEDRDNRQITGNVSWQMDRGGRHDVKTGAEWYRATNTGGNSQSSTGFVFIADFATNAAGDPTYDSGGRLIPVFVPGETLMQTWIPTRGATLNIDTTSLFAQDRWSPTSRLTLDAGVRYERVRGEATGELLAVDTDTVVPRLGATYDLTGAGKYVLQATYGHYAGKYSEAQFSQNTNVGNPNELVGIYTGPAGQGRGFAAGFNPGNYSTIFGDFPTANVFFADGLSSPTTREWTLQAGGELGSRGFGKVVYIHRNVGDFVEDFVTLDNGATTVIRDGRNYGTFDNKVFRNSGEPVRRYQALQFQSRYTLSDSWSLNGHWTVQLKNEGNFEGEGTNQPGLSSVIGDYPEIHDPARHFPVGPTDDFQRHRVRLWTIHNVDVARFGTFTSSLLWRYEGSQAYSLAAVGVPLTSVQEARLAELGYASGPADQTIYFGRGTERFDDYSIVDASFNYQIPIWDELRPWLKMDLFNVFNYNEPYRHNTTVRLDPNSPVDALGIPTGFVPGPNFGRPTSSTDYPRPYGGEVGGRTFRMAFGVRF
jgi:outer membrane receptor protein involved in Fe transport